MTGASMTGASDVLDPVEAAHEDISRSKHLIASTLDDLTQHHSWLENYHREERRRAQRLAREDALRRLERKRQRAAWLLRRFATTALAVTRTTMAFLMRNGIAFAAWAAPRARAHTLTASSLLSAGLSWSWAWSWARGRSLARKGFEAAKTGFAWSVRTSEAAGVVFRRRMSANYSVLSAKAAVLAAPGRKRAAIGWTRTRLKARRFAFILATTLSDGWSKTQSAMSHWLTIESPRLGRVLATEIKAGTLRTRVQAEGVSRAALKASSDGWSWAALRARRILARGATSKHRALIVRRSTALVCREPQRTGLPAVLTG